VAQLTGERNTAARNRNTYRNQVQAKNRTLRNTNARRAAAEQQVHTTQQQMESMQREYQALLAQAQAKAAELTDQLAALRPRLEAAAVALRGAQTGQQEHSTLQAEYQRLRDRYEALRQEKDDCDRQVERLVAERQQQQVYPPPRAPEYVPQAQPEPQRQARSVPGYMAPTISSTLKQRNKYYRGGRRTGKGPAIRILNGTRSNKSAKNKGVKFPKIRKQIPHLW
jgi:hypothetical protein